MHNSKNKLILFSIGALGYGLLEILWRGHTHWSMLGAGGICFVFFANLGKKMKQKALIIKAFIGSCFVTAIELIFGIIFNIILKKNVWDYSRIPLNFAGQVCLLYSFFWMLLSILLIPFATFIEKSLNRKNHISH